MVKKYIKKWGLSVISIITGTILIFILLLIFNINTEKTVEKFIHNSIDEMNHTAILSLHNNFSNFVDLLEQQSKIFGMLENPSDEKIISTLVDFAGDGRFKNTAIVTYDGKVYSSVRNITEVKNSEKQPNLKKDATIISQPRIFADGTLVVDISTPVYINNKKIGKLVVSVDSKNISKMVYGNVLQGEASIYLATKEGKIITKISQRESLLDINSNILDFFKDKNIEFSVGSNLELMDNLSENKSGWLKYDYTKQKICVFYEPFGINDWYMFISSTDTTLNTQTNDLKKLALYLTSGILFVVIIASIIVVVQRVKEQKKLDALKNTYSIAISKTNDLFYEADIDNDIFIDHSENTNKAIWKETPKNYSNALLQIAELCVPECKQQFLDNFLPQNIKIKMEEGISSINFEYKINVDESTVRWLSATFVPISDGSGNSTKLICMENDITEQKMKQESLKKSATIDGLTGIYNKTTTKNYIDSFIASEEEGIKHAFVIIDIDFFKSINDNLGHAKGDEVLVEFAHALKKIFRKSDIVGRIGGDEFVIMIKEYGITELIISKMNEVMDVIRKEHYLIDDKTKVIKTSASIGIALYNQDGKSFDELYKNADSALYVSKQLGRDRFTFFENTIIL